MAVPATPSNLVVQSGNGDVYLSWNITAGALSYDVQRSADGVTFTSIASSPVNSYSDSTALVQVQYYYRIAAVNVSGSSTYTVAQIAIPTLPGTMSLYAMRLLAQQKADRVGSNFVGLAEWNVYINQSATELYDLLITEYEDYFVTPVPYAVTTMSNQQNYNLPDGSAQYTINGVKAPAFYKLMGVDLSLDNSNNARVTIGKFDFIQRNRYVYPSVTSTFLGVFNLQYRLMGNVLIFIPPPAAGQVVNVWYVPRLNWLLKDTDVLDVISGWSELVCLDAAIKALQKEESDVSVLAAQKEQMLERIRTSAMNRDVGQPDTISPTRTSRGYNWNGDGSSGGY